MSAVILSLVAKKGGVGKTSFTINLAGAFAKQGMRVLAVDMEGQASLTQFWLGVEATEKLVKARTLAALLDDTLIPDPQAIIHATRCPGIWLAPASPELARHERAEPENAGPVQFALRDCLLAVANDFDLILIDTPPYIDGLLCWSALLASRFVITPLQPEMFSVQALIGVQRLVDKAIQFGNPQLRLLGYVINHREKRPALHNLTEERVRQLHGQQVFATVVPKMQAYCDAIPYQKPITEFQPRGKASKVIQELAGELLARMGVPPKETAKPAPRSRSRKKVA